MSSSLVSMCCDGFNTPRSSWSLYNCDLTQTFVCFPGWSTISFGLSGGSFISGYHMLSSLSCIEKTGS